MDLNKQIAKQFRDLHFGGNWTAVNLKNALSNIGWKQATTKVNNSHTIAALVFHINYYVSAVLKVLKGEPLNASDKFSFDLPPITSEEDWKRLVNKMLTDAELFVEQIETLDEAKLFEDFVDPKYGSYFFFIVHVSF